MAYKIRYDETKQPTKSNPFRVQVLASAFFLAFLLGCRPQHILYKNAVASCGIVHENMRELMISAVQQICRYQSSNTTLIFLTRIDLT